LLIDVVQTMAEAEALEVAPLAVLEPLEAALPGAGPIELRRIGEGHSNVTFLVSRDSQEWIMRRPPRPPFPARAHDVLREYRTMKALEPTPVRVPKMVMFCEDESVIGAPFFLMEKLDGLVVHRQVPAALDADSDRRGMVEELVDGLVELHRVDPAEVGLDGLGRAEGFLERQVSRWHQRWQQNQMREVQKVDELATELERTRPQTSEVTVVHGDYMLNNVMLAPWSPARLLAILDWELATVGDPMTDVGWLTATYVEPEDPADGVLAAVAPITRERGFPRRAFLAERYAEQSGRSLESLPWYQAHALWKIAILLEGSYRRHLAGFADDPFYATLERGVPDLVDQAVSLMEG
jgi:aminoglycoside phosphotransferase (APT) family kinase protein